MSDLSVARSPQFIYDFEQRTILQADKLLSQACENRKMLLEHEQEVLPYALRSLLKKSGQERETGEIRLKKLLSLQESLEEEKNKEGTIFQEIHRSFNMASDRLCMASAQLNKSLSVELDQMQ